MGVRKHALLKGIIKTGYIMIKLKFIAVERFWNTTAETYSFLQRRIYEMLQGAGKDALLYGLSHREGSYRNLI